MVTSLRRLFDIRRGELAPTAFSFAYVALVVASFLLAKPIRNGLFLRDYGAHSLVYVYAAVPVVLSLAVPAAGRLAARIGRPAMNVVSLWFFAANAIVFWALFRNTRLWFLPAIFYIWVNCYAVIAPVQAWSFVNSLFDTRQAKRLFGLIGAGASLGAIAGGALGRMLVGRLGTVNLLLVLAALIATSAVLVTAAARNRRRAGRPTSSGLDRPSPQRAGAPSFADAVRTIVASRYLRLIAIMVFFVAIATQWVGFQLNLEAERRFGDDADRLTSFFSAFNIYTGSAAFAIQLFLTGRVLRRFGITATVLLLPLALFSGSTLILLIPVFWTVLLTAGVDQGLRFSIDKASYEVLYLPLTGRQRAQLKAAIDIIVNRFADAVGGILLGIATEGFFGIRGFGFGLRGTAAIYLALFAIWAAVAWRLRSEYVAAIGESIRTHRLEAERAASAAVEKTAAEAVAEKLASGDDVQVLYALDVLDAQQNVRPNRALHRLLRHSSDDIRRRAMRLLNESGDKTAPGAVAPLVRDVDMETRAEALLYLSRYARVDPVAAVRDLEEFPEYSIRASMAAFLAAPGKTQNVEAARVLLRAMLEDAGPDAGRIRHEAARLVELRPEVFESELPSFLAADETDPDVLRHAARACAKLGAADLTPLLIPRLANEAVAADIVDALVQIGERALPYVRAGLSDPRLSLDARRELPVVLARVGTPEAEEMLVEALLQGDAALRFRIIAALNKVRQTRPDTALDPQVLELVLAAEIIGHYRSYQVLDALQQQKESDEVIKGLRRAMEHELERIFRLIGLIAPRVDVYSAYVAVNAPDRTVHANALEFLETSLEPRLTQLLLPLIDPQVNLAERVKIANRIVGAEIDSVEGAISTLLASDDAWLQETARAARERLGRAEQAAGMEHAIEPAAIASGL